MLLGEARAEALHEHVGVVDELEHAVAVAREVDSHRSFSGVRGEPERSVVADERRPPGACVISLGRLDLDHVRAERGQELRAIRAGERRRDVDDDLPFEGPEGHRSSENSRVGTPLTSTSRS